MDFLEPPPFRRQPSTWFSFVAMAALSDVKSRVLAGDPSPADSLCAWPLLKPNEPMCAVTLESLLTVRGSSYQLSAHLGCKGRLWADRCPINMICLEAAWAPVGGLCVPVNSESGRPALHPDPAARDP